MNRAVSNFRWVGFLSLAGFLFLWAFDASASTYYISPSGSDTSGNGTIGSPFKTLTKAMATGAGGDTFIYKNGTYNYSGCEITESIKNGSAGAYTIIKAENDGGAILTQMDSMQINSARSYIQIEGFKFDYAGEKKFEYSNHLKILRCAFVGGPSSGNVVNTDSSQSSYVLFEDCWFYGRGGRYNLLIYYSDHFVVRRCVFRHDGGWTDTKGDPEAITNAYTSSYIYYQNCIAMDSGAAYYHEPYGAFYTTADSTTSNISWEGCIALNGTNAAFAIDPKSGASENSLTLKDSIAYAYQYGVYVQTGGHLTVLRTTVGNITAGAGIDSYGGSISASYSNSFNNSGGNFGGATVTYSNSYPSAQSGTGNVNVNPLNNGLSYLPRTEDGSYLATHQAGGRMGAQIVNRIGVTGTLYGETGWNTDTGVALWPFPNEARIKADMATVSTRGFAASGATLTKYIWEYLGNSMPGSVGGKVPTVPVIIGIQ